MWHSNTVEPLCASHTFAEQLLVRLANNASKSRAAENEDGAHGEQQGVGKAVAGATPAEQFGRDGKKGK